MSDKEIIKSLEERCSRFAMVVGSLVAIIMRSSPSDKDKKWMFKTIQDVFYDDKPINFDDDIQK